MYLCSTGHDEVAHEGNECPACKIKNERDELESKVQELESEVETLASDLEQCEKENR